jgi:hypothetical protein
MERFVAVEKRAGGTAAGELGRGTDANDLTPVRGLP